MMGMDGGRRLLDQETSKAENTGYTLRRFAHYFKRYWVGLLLTMILIVGSTWTQVVSPDLIGQAIDCYLFPQVQNPDACWYATVAANATADERIVGLGGLVLLLTGLFILGSILTGLSFYAMNWTGQSALRRIRQDLFHKIHQLSMGFYSKSEAGDVMSRLTNDADTVQQAFSFALLQVVSGVLLMLWIALEMFQTNAVYALLSLAIVPVMGFATFYFSSQARKAFRRARQEMGTVNADLQESIAGAREVQAFNREEESIAQFELGNEANRAANIRAALFTSALRPILESLGYVSLAIVVIIGGLVMLGEDQAIGGSVITLGIVFAFIQYVQRVNQPIAQIAILWTNIQSAFAGGERIFNLLDTEIDITDKPDATKMPLIQGRVVFDNAQAEYVQGEPVLSGVSLEAKPGEMIAIVGPTGAGKTTMINLIPRFYDVTGGKVEIDSIDVRDVTIHSLRQQIGIVLQDTFLFSTTVMENIRYGKLDATDDEVIAAAKLATVHEFIERLSDGYQTILGERGSGLSQGQRQLIAIARVALMNPRILILDEATSSVDTRTERMIQAAFEKLLEGRTSFVIAHRLSTIRNADQVLMVDNGQIIERGTHRTLLEQKGAYYDLYMSQFQQEDDAPIPTNGHGKPEESPVAGD